MNPWLVTLSKMERVKIFNVSNHINSASRILRSLKKCMQLTPISTRTRATLTKCIFIFQDCVRLAKCLIRGNARCGMHKEGEIYYGCPIFWNRYIIKLSMNWMFNTTKKCGKKYHGKRLIFIKITILIDYTFCRNLWT